MIIFAYIFSFILRTSAEECKITEHFNKSYKVYYNWPFTYSCTSALSDNTEYDYGYFPQDGGDEFSCVITDVKSKKVVLNSSFADFFEPHEGVIFTIGNITETTGKVYDTKIQKGSSCLVYRVTLEPLHLEVDSCKENLERRGSYTVPSKHRRTFQAHCEAPANTSDVPKQLIYEAGGRTKIYWLYNCQESLPDNTMVDHDDYSLIFSSISYETNPGIYTCVIEHNGMKRYRIHYRMCVEPRISPTLSMKCSNKTALVGSDVVIDCFIDGGVGVDSGFMFSGRFNRLNSLGYIDFAHENSSCVAYVTRNTTASDERFSCYLHAIKPLKPKCFDKTPTNEDLESQKTLLRMTYRIKNVQSSDYGTYQATIIRASDPETVKFSVIIDRSDFLAKSNIILIIFLAGFGGAAAIGVLIWLMCGIEIRRLWYKYCKPTERESKPYIAYLAYYYDKEMTITPPQQLENFVRSLNKALGSNGGVSYDRCRDSLAEQYMASSVSAKLSECHRVIIILTQEYINDQWSVFEAYEAWKSVIENGIKIIFIRFPKTMTAINDLPENSRIALKKALKRHKVVDWDGTLPFPRKLRIRLELLMPKLSPQIKVEMHRINERQNEVATVKPNDRISLEPLLQLHRPNS